MLVYCLYMYSHDIPGYPCRSMFLFYLISIQTTAEVVAQVFIYNHIYILRIHMKYTVVVLYIYIHMWCQLHLDPPLVPGCFTCLPPKKCLWAVDPLEPEVATLGQELLGIWGWGRVIEWLLFMGTRWCFKGGLIAIFMYLPSGNMANITNVSFLKQ
jgi:hypothetical protein